MTETIVEKGVQHTGYILPQGEAGSRSLYNPSGFVLFSSKTDSLAKTFISREEAVKYAAKENIKLKTVSKRTARKAGKAA